MSNRAHSGRSFRSWRRTRARKLAQGKTWEIPTRWKVPLALRPFLTGSANQARAKHDVFALAVSRYVQHKQLTGQGPPVRAAGAPRGR